ncbi:MAG: riboflavin synthase [Bryobacterales bacterium]|nr:riboflavin synthase [Bryobacterales bacterium]MDE0264218.1 riboflavin synthase [Bryobacterales bacterium]MDE0622250.1 riboflavin synthase [Bryobacterales bacterium]
MFTGIVEETGAVLELARSSAGARMVVAAREVLADLSTGGSIAVNGCCLTAVDFDERGFSADLSPETLDRTNLGALEAGSIVNLERPLLPTSRLSGHFVLGHVDGTGEVLGLDAVGDGNWWLSVRAPEDLLKFLVYKGSIAIDGISLTIASLDADVLGCAIIPHTYEVTTLRSLRVGTSVNLECDMLAKHVHRLLAAGSADGPSTGA